MDPAANARLTADGAWVGPRQTRPDLGAEQLGRIGPNAVLQLVAALQAAGREALLPDLFAAAHCPGLLIEPPQTMVDERAVARLFRAVHVALAQADALLIMSDAGRRTADYVLAHRIPKPAQAVLKALPAFAARPALAAAISKHAWTFAGSGKMTVAYRPTLTFEIADNPLSVTGRNGVPGPCAWHAAVFTRLFQALVGTDLHFAETACCSRGEAACRFELRRAQRQ